ncbi:putative NADH dehydrogenase [ubiquinone] 1 alpha subcomplex subunit 12 [Frankliniella fusca]|uniref:NADH dehydrogenase [ubiquinone] 1 alpha subcomplex subunit 12 n=1 Tax=Frankliniella fusca TaxID=407009 RepID=A0AAE1H3C1_9NEOP|nr:putative NADH dehydrogenase [ubiquinone] 1 alpha subcomplex subunit 12 [Frankliniella fusca]
MTIFERIWRLHAIIKWNGGLKQSISKLFYYDDLKIGCLVGIDQFGNKYYENNNYFFGRNRWVEYSPAVGLDYDASMVPAEWFGWLHYRTDYKPCQDPTRPSYSWQKPHIMNQSGTRYQYVPYDTTLPKIHEWAPSNNKQASKERSNGNSRE